MPPALTGGGFPYLDGARGLRLLAVTLVKYLREGLLCLDRIEGGFELLDLVTGSLTAIDEAQADAARRLVRGLDGGAAEEATAAVGAERVEERDGPFDRVVGARLAALDGGFGWARPDSAAELVELSERAHSALRHLRSDLDQHPALPETAARRALELQARAGEGARVVLVGDDDLVAAPAAALGLDVTVLDLDPDLVALHELLAARLDLSWQVRPTDLREPLEGALLGAFDGFCTDPETTRECISVFASRGVAMVRPGGVGLLSCSEDFASLVDEAVLAMGLERLALHQRFSSYRDSLASLSPYRSDLHVFRVPEGARPLVAPEAPFAEELFPFGLFGGEHLLVRATGCDPSAAVGGGLVTLSRDLVAAGGGAPEVRVVSPVPVRVIRAEAGETRVQVTVHADGTTVELDLSPAPAEAEAAAEVTGALKRALAAASVTARVLKRVEEEPRWEPAETAGAPPRRGGLTP